MFFKKSRSTSDTIFQKIKIAYFSMVIRIFKKWVDRLFGALAGHKPLVLPGVSIDTLVYVIK